MTPEPAIARAIQAENNLYDQIDAEFGLLNATEAGHRMGSRSNAPRHRAAAARTAGRLLAIQHDARLLYPGFQFDDHGEPLPVIAQLRDLANRHGRSETGIVQWLCSPTTYLDGRRPVDLLRENPTTVLDAAEQAWGVQW